MCIRDSLQAKDSLFLIFLSIKTSFFKPPTPTNLVEVCFENVDNSNISVQLQLQPLKAQTEFLPHLSSPSSQIKGSATLGTSPKTMGIWVDFWLSLSEVYQVNDC